MSYLVRSLGGDRLVTIVTLALVATFFNILLAVLLEYARILYSSGRDRAWPTPLSRTLGRIHPTTRTPVVATLAIGAAALALTAVSDYAAAVTFASLAGVAVTVVLQTGRDLAILAAGLLYDAAYLRPRRDTHWILLDPLIAQRDADDG